MADKAQLCAKRLFDLVVCSVILVGGCPILLLLALFVRVSSIGPVFFLQMRVGKGEKPFRIVKFRTMVGLPSEDVMRWTKSEEARITPIGKLMRDYGLDELPQLLNIFRGDMSIIGPRAPLPQQASQFSAHHKKMFSMRPGVLSLAAVEGRRSLTMEERYDFHVKYVERWSLRLDLNILWRSFVVVSRRESATESSIGE